MRFKFRVFFKVINIPGWKYILLIALYHKVHGIWGPIFSDAKIEQCGQIPHYNILH